MKVYRVLEYDGPEDWVQMVIGRSIHGVWAFNDEMKITAVTVEEVGKELMRKLKYARQMVWTGFKEAAHGESGEV